MNKKNLILRIQEYCKDYETKFVGYYDLVDMICVEMFKKPAFSTDKCGKITGYSISKEEAHCIKEFLDHMESKNVIIKKAKSFEIMPSILNYKHTR